MRVHDFGALYARSRFTFSFVACHHIASPGSHFRHGGIADGSVRARLAQSVHLKRSIGCIRLEVRQNSAFGQLRLVPAPSQLTQSLCSSDEALETPSAGC